jgi:hypothetical protein
MRTISYESATVAYMSKKLSQTDVAIYCSLFDLSVNPMNFSEMILFLIAVLWWLCKKNHPFLNCHCRSFAGLETWSLVLALRETQTAWLWNTKRSSWTSFQPESLPHGLFTLFLEPGAGQPEKLRDGMTTILSLSMGLYTVTTIPEPPTLPSYPPTSFSAGSEIYSIPLYCGCLQVGIKILTRLDMIRLLIDSPQRYDHNPALLVSVKGWRGHRNCIACFSHSGWEMIGGYSLACKCWFH